MSTPRFIATCAVGFLVSEILAVIFFGYLLGADYEPFRGTLLRSSDALEWPMLVSLPFAHLAFVIGFVWMYVRLATPSGSLRDGLRFGLMAWVMTQVPQWLLWYAEQPWPGQLIAKQLALELVCVLALSAVVTMMCRSPIAARRRRGSLDSSLGHDG